MIPLAVLSGLLLVALLWQQREHRLERADTEQRHQAERERLADRIQRPDLLPLRDRTAPPPEPADPSDAKAFAQVGTVTPWRDDDVPDDGLGP